MIKIKGTIKKVFYSSPRWSSVIIEVIEPEKLKWERIKASGNLPNPIEDLIVEITGEQKEDNKYGEYIDVKTCEFVRTNSPEWIKSYLSKLSYVSEGLAEKIYKEFGKKSIEVLENEPEKFLSINGIGKKKLDKIVESHRNRFALMEIFKICNGEITLNQASKIFEVHGAKSASILKNNPYELIYSVNGFGFSKVDSIAKSLGIKEDSHSRVGAALVYILKTLSEQEGHCFCDVEMLQNESLKLLCPVPQINKVKTIQSKIEKELITIADEWEDNKERVLNNFSLSDSELSKIEKWINERDKFTTIIAECLLEEIKANHIVYEDSDNEYEGERVYWKFLYDAEMTISNISAEMALKKPIKKISLDVMNAKIIDTERKMGYQLGKEQRDAILTSLQNRFSIITGGPGRGKTTIIKTILDIWDDDSSVILCAPTGKAAQRMSESTGRKSSTIHRNIIISNRKKETVKDKLIIIDETSMLDVQIAKEVFEYAKDSTLILVGDVDQLPSIGPGSFFRDIINSKIVPTVVLKHGYRNEGSIAKNSEKINEGLSLKHMEKDEFFVFDETSKDYIQESIINIYDNLLKKYQIKDICILSPMRQRSQSGTEILNNIIREHINPENPWDPKLKSVKFRINDRIMYTHNNFKKEVCKNGHIELGVFNGDCGFVKDINVEDSIVTVEFDDGRVGEFEVHEMQDFILAYCMTIHKSQGSEYPAVIIPFSTEHFVMLKRNLLYTAVTRGKKEVHIVGDKRAFDMAVRNTDYKYRNSMLKQRITTKYLDLKEAN